MAATADSSSSSSSSRAATAVVSMTHSSSSLPSPWSHIVRNNTAVNNNNNNYHDEPPLPPPQQVQSPSPSPSLSQPLAAAVEQQNPPSPTESPPPPPPAENSVLAAESSSGNNGNAAVAAAAARQRRPAWNVPVPATSETDEGSHLIGDDVAWPALLESTRGGGAPRQSPPSLDAASSSRSVAEGLNSSSQGSFIPNSPNRATSNANSSHNITLNHSGPSRHRSNRRGGAGSGNNNNNNNNNGSNSNGGLPPHTGFPRPIPSPPPLPPPFPTFPVPPNPYFVPPSPPPEFPIREPPFRGNNWDNRPAGGFMSQPHVMNDHRSSSRRGRGDGSSHNSHGNRRDRDRGNYTSARDAHVQPQRGASRGFVRPLPPLTAPPIFLVPPPVRSFGSPMGFSDMTSQFYVPSMHIEPFRGVPFIAHAPPSPVFIPQDPPLPVRIVNQIDYYFSDENLVKDDYLKSKMDDEGWVPILLIARFPRVMHLTTDTHLVLDSLRASTIVEVQGDRVRRRNGWRRWICSSVPLSAEAGSSSSGGSNNDNLVESLQQMMMEEGTGNSNMTSNTHLQSENVNGRDMELAGQEILPNSNCVDVASSSQA